MFAPIYNRTHLHFESSQNRRGMVSTSQCSHLLCSFDEIVIEIMLRISQFGHRGAPSVLM